MNMEKAMGNTTDILLATVVTEIPAFLEEKAIRKNIRMNIIPMMTLRLNQLASQMEFRETSSALIRNPRIVAVR
jgi:hypothetical protein